MGLSTGIPDLTTEEYRRMAKIYPLLSMREKLAVHKHVNARTRAKDALGIQQPQQPTDPKAIR